MRTLRFLTKSAGTRIVSCILSRIVDLIRTILSVLIFSQVSDYIMEWVFNTYNDLLVNEDQNSKGWASTMAQWLSFQCLPFLCCHFFVAGSDVLPSFSLLFFDPKILMSCYVRFQESLLHSEQQIAVQTGDSTRDQRSPEMTTARF